MDLSVSARIAEGFLSKEKPAMSLAEFTDLAVEADYRAVCMRGSQIGVHSNADQITAASELLRSRKLSVSMITGDFDIVYNNDRGPACLRNITPYLNLAEALGASMIRVCVKCREDIPHAQNASDEAARRGLRLVHQCHVQSLFETIEQIQDTLRKINRVNFGLIYEPANLEECRQDYGSATIRELSPWIFNVYLQNQRLTPKGSITLQTWSQGPVSFDVIPIPAPGGIDFASVFRGLRQINYGGPLTVHQSAPQDGKTTPTDSAKETAAFLKSCLNTAR
ncbi:MAG: sugar phosphate isomerase/epimerase [Verrucomicrobia bacterium]|nr:sugar phosphate isomerase/epimerase [Verrucomicrobiota bacterium]